MGPDKRSRRRVGNAAEQSEYRCADAGAMEQRPTERPSGRRRQACQPDHGRDRHDIDVCEHEQHIELAIFGARGGQQQDLLTV
jgi:hypothetical protein